MRHRLLQAAPLTIALVILFTPALASDRGRSGRGTTSARSSVPLQGTRLHSNTGDSMGMYYPLSSRDVNKGRIGTQAGDPDTACRADPGAIYCNSLSPGWWQPPLEEPNIGVGDDAALAASAGCELDRYVIKVDGDPDGLGSGPYTVDAALYTTCPGALGASPIPGTECQVTLPDENAALVVCDAVPGTTFPSSNIWVEISFDRLHCAIAVGAPATRGFSADVLDFPGFACRANLGGFEPASNYDDYGKHASFFLEIYARGDCADPTSDPPTEAFPNYRGSNHDGPSYTPGGGIWFADDVSLEVPQCSVTAIEVAIKGVGVTSIDLRTALSDADPANGGVIPGTEFFVIGGPNVVVGRKYFEPPISLPQSDLWVGYQTTSAVTGPIVADRWPDLGSNQNAFWYHDGTRWWEDPFFAGEYAATDVTIHCAGSPPTGSCCDMVFTDNLSCVGGDNHGLPCATSVECSGGTCLGDSVCRDDLPKMNCATRGIPALWVQEGVCEGICVEGDNDGAVCTRQVDCPGGYECVGGPNEGEPCESNSDCADGECKGAECDGPFVRSCGLAACCTYANQCLSLTQKECFEVHPIDDPQKRMFQVGQYCGIDGQRCPFGSCIGREGDCYAEQDLPGCEDPFCCTAVCNHDLFCCLVVWDAFCVEEAMEVCPTACIHNSDCNDNSECTADRCEEGACTYPSLEAGAPCGDPTDTPCNHADTCSGSGICMSNLVPAETPCGDQTDTICDHADTCNGSGTCAHNVVPNGTACPDDVFCNGEEMCQVGECVDGPTPCPVACDEQYDRCLPRLRDPVTTLRRR